MLDVKIKPAEELIIEKKLRNPITLTTSEEQKPKFAFFRNKMKDLINYHLDYEKYNKKLISADALKEITQYENDDQPSIPYHRRAKSQDHEKPSEILQLKDSLLNKISTLEKISTLIKSANRISNSLENIENQEQLLSKISSSNHIFLTIQDLINNDINNYHLILTSLETFYQKQVNESLNMKKDLAKRHKQQLEDLTKKNEGKIKALAQHNKFLASQKYENRLQQSFKDKIQSLENSLKISEFQAEDKADQVKQKNFEIQHLNDSIYKLKEQKEILEKQILDLEQLVKIQQESYQGQIYDLTSEVARLKNTSQDKVLAYENDITNYKYQAESSNYRLEQALSDLNFVDKQLDDTKKQVIEKDYIIDDLNLEIKRLDRIILDLKEAYDASQKSLETEKFIISQNKDSQIANLHDMIVKLESESNQLLKSNKELNLWNEKLESKMSSVSEKKSLKSSKSEKKIKARK